MLGSVFPICHLHYIEFEIECDLVWATNDFFNQPDYIILLFKIMTTLPPCGIPHLDRKNTSKLEILIATFQLSVRFETGFLEKLSVFKVSCFFSVFYLRL